jgi:enamine deaminase RidA (YjgF/YER057c/UK114 family)
LRAAALCTILILDNKQERDMQTIIAFIAIFASAILQLVSASAQEAMEKKSYNYSAWTPGIFSEAVAITNMGKGKFIFLAGIGAEDENGPRGAIRHKGDFAAQCTYAYDKIKRTLAANGSSLKDAVKMTVYVTDMRNRLEWAKCSGAAFDGTTVPAQTLLGISQLAFPEMMLEIDVTAVAHE